MTFYLIRRDVGSIKKGNRHSEILMRDVEVFWSASLFGCYPDLRIYVAAPHDPGIIVQVA